MAAADLHALGLQEIAQHPAAREREVEMQLVHPAHDGEIGRGHGSRQAVDAAPADVQRLRLAGDGQRVRPVDHRLALSRPALLSAPSKKSFARVSSPILACRVLTSTGGGAPGMVRASAPNTPAAPSRSSAFQAVIWFGWTSNCCASSASVFSPLMAARATFALKAGLWFRRDRLVIVSPVREPSRPLSGRNATYPPVRIRRASSPRSARSYSGLDLDDALAARGIHPRCGLMVVDLRTGRLAHGLWIESEIEELYDTVVLPDVRW